MIGGRAVFLDRDDTILRDPGYLDDPDKIVLLSGAGEGMRRMVKAGYRLVLVTNQSGIARGYFSEARLGEIHERLVEHLASQRVALDGIYYCPHHAEGSVPEYTRSCECRKPAPGLLLRAAAELGIDLAASVMIGDKAADVGAGQAAGCRTIWIGVDAADLVEAAELIVTAAQ